MNIPKECYFAKSHEFCKVDDDIAIVGISDFAQSQLGDITYVELPEIGEKFDMGDAFGTVEAVKAASDLYAPISGEVIAVNEELEENPEVVNDDPYEKGWFIKLRISDELELENLMKADEYEATLS